MTAMLNQSSQTVRKLIDSCCETHQQFRSAAEAVGDNVLKQLFGLYAQQRCRFAEELRGYTSSEEPRSISMTVSASSRAFTTDADLLERCLRNDKQAMALYREALTDHTI